MSEEEEKVIISVTPDTIKPKGAVRRNSTGKVNTKTLQSPSSSNEKLLPHYLRASTGSCHDFCKYGRKHAFEAKKKHPNLPRFSGNNEIPDEEQNQAKVSTLREIRKRSELKMKTTQQRDKLPDKPKVVKQKGLKKTQLSDTLKNLDEESSEESKSMKLMTPSPFQESIVSLEDKPFSEGEGSSEESISIKTVTPSPAHKVEEFFEESETIKLETPSPIEKNIVSHIPTPLTWSEGSSDGSASMELETPSSIHTPVNQVEGSSEEPVRVELMTPLPVLESIATTDEPTRMKLKTPPSDQKSLKPKTPPPTRKSIASAKLTPPGRAEKISEENLSMKLKAPSLIHKSIAATEEQHGMKSLKMGEGKKKEVTKLKTAPQAKTEVSVRAKAIKEKKIEVIGEPNNIRKKTPPAKKTITSVKPNITEQKSRSSVKEVITSVSPRVIKQKKASSPLKRIDVPAKSLSLKPKTPVVKSTSALVPSSRLTAQRNEGNKMIRSADLSKLGEEKVLKPLRASLSPKPPVYGVSNMKLRKYRSSKPSTQVDSQAKVEKLEHTGEKVKEKTLYVIEPKPVKIDLKPIKKKPKKNKSYYSSQTSSSSSSPSSSSFVSSHERKEHEDYESTLSGASELALDHGTKRNKPVRSPKGKDKRKPSTVTVQSEEKLPSPRKLKFRRGKVVSPKSENNGPRKLRFRQAKRASENQNSKEVGRRSFRKRRESCGSETDLITQSSEAPAVVLRRQDVQEKKDSQGLFNHVIEETASKLVETRRSKVKALVGAFETVISLQESRVPPTV